MSLRINIFPPLAPWQVPQFLSSCNIACCLERKFPVAFHAPRLPREILSSGAVLICSHEVAEKQFFYENLVHLKNCVIVNDPTDHEELEDLLYQLVTNREMRAYIGQHGKFLSKTVEEFLPEENSMLTAIHDLFDEKLES